MKVDFKQQKYFNFYVGIKSVLVLKCIFKSSLRDPGLKAWPCTALQVSAQRNCFWLPTVKMQLKRNTLAFGLHQITQHRLCDQWEQHMFLEEVLEFLYSS